MTEEMTEEMTKFDKFFSVTNSKISSSGFEDIETIEGTLKLSNNSIKIFYQIFLENDSFSISLTIDGIELKSFLNFSFLDDYEYHNLVFYTIFEDIYLEQNPDIFRIMGFYLENAIRSAFNFPIIGERNREVFFDENTELDYLRRINAYVSTETLYPTTFSGLCFNQFVIFSAISFKSEDNKVVYLPCYLIIEGQEDISFLIKVYLTDIKNVLTRLLPTYRIFKGNLKIRFPESINVSILGINQLLLCYENPDSPGASLCIYSIILNEKEHTVVFEIPSILI
jgi:hypothetical protein